MVDLPFLPDLIQRVLTVLDREYPGSFYLVVFTISGLFWRIDSQMRNKSLNAEDPTARSDYSEASEWSRRALYLSLIAALLYFPAVLDISRTASAGLTAFAYGVAIMLIIRSFTLTP
jgi:hypothetical protein